MRTKKAQACWMRENHVMINPGLQLLFLLLLWLDKFFRIFGIDIFRIIERLLRMLGLWDIWLMLQGQFPKIV